MVRPRSLARGGTTLSTVLLVGLAVVVMGLTGKVLLGSSDAVETSAQAPGRAPAPLPSPAASVATASSRSQVLFVGGWITEGADSSVAGRAAESLGWRPQIASHHGAAFMRGGTDGSAPLARQVMTDAGGTPPAAVVVSAGAFDLTRSTADERLALIHMIDRLRVTVPDTTQLVVIGPPPPAGDDPAHRGLRTVLAAAAKERHVHFGDPVLDDWTADGGGTAALASALSSFLSQLHIDAA